MRILYICLLLLGLALALPQPQQEEDVVEVEEVEEGEELDGKKQLCSYCKLNFVISTECIYTVFVLVLCRHIRENS